MTTAGEILRALSGLPSATAAEHLIAAENGADGTNTPVFGVRFSIVASEPRDWVAVSSGKTHLFVGEAKNSVAQTVPGGQIVSETEDRPVSVQREDRRSMFVRLAQQHSFLRVEEQRPFVRVGEQRIFIRVQ